MPFTSPSLALDFYLIAKANRGCRTDERKQLPTSCFTSVLNAAAATTTSLPLAQKKGQAPAAAVAAGLGHCLQGAPSKASPAHHLHARAHSAFRRQSRGCCALQLWTCRATGAKLAQIQSRGLCYHLRRPIQLGLARHNPRSSSRFSWQPRARHDQQ